MIYIRYLQIKEVINDSNGDYHNLNKINLMFGYCAALGLSVVANFQETNQITVHWTGAVCAFGGGALYQVIQVTQTSCLET